MAEGKVESDEKPTSEVYELSEDNELRFEVEQETVVELQLLEGLAEIFGSEITLKKKYSFGSGAKVAVFTYHGCKLKLIGRPEVAYVSKDTPMLMYLNTHAAMEQMRQKAEDSRGPRVMITGPTDVGKSTLCRLLVNYAARLGRGPLYVELDVGQGSISVPGTVGATAVERPMDVEQTFADCVPIVFHYGHLSPADNLSLYKRLTTRLADVVNLRCENSSRANTSGVVINTCGWVKDGGLDVLLHAAEAFEVDVVVVLDQERLYSQLLQKLPESVKILLLPKSRGVVSRSKKARSDARDARIRQYFYGPNNDLFPHTVDVKYSEIKLFKIGGPQLPDSCMPLGQKAEDSQTKVMPEVPNSSLLNRILSVSCTTRDDANLLTTNVAGFVVVLKVDSERETLTLLSPCPKPLKSHIFLVSDLQFIDIK